ncbi:MAG TPA: SDR family NAD(P)-dependent oxidoreductase [Bryobacteraceae bacterium]|nr:SDR family NAD(P)-dependent oxidoreductase [Bryobacteraceae bacterium]
MHPADSPVVLITGGSAGIGAACVRKFLAEGWRASVLALEDQNLEWLDTQGIVVTAGDITLNEVRETAVRSTLAAFGRIDVLINSAGVGLYAPPTAVRADLFSRLLEVNVIAPLALAQMVIPPMLERKSGVIVTMGSVAGYVALPWAAAYSASKAALHSLHDALRVELRHTPINLMKVCPGIVNTKFREHALGGKAPDRVLHIRRVVSPEAVASAIFDGVKSRRRTVYVPAVGWLFSLLGRLAPGLMDFYLSRFQPYDEVVARSTYNNEKAGD